MSSSPNKTCTISYVHGPRLVINCLIIFDVLACRDQVHPSHLLWLFPKIRSTASIKHVDHYCLLSLNFSTFKCGVLTRPTNFSSALSVTSPVIHLNMDATGWGFTVRLVRLHVGLDYSKRNDNFMADFSPFCRYWSLLPTSCDQSPLSGKFVHFLKSQTLKLHRWWECYTADRHIKTPHTSDAVLSLITCHESIMCDAVSTDVVVWYISWSQSNAVWLRPFVFVLGETTKLSCCVWPFPLALTA